MNFSDFNILLAILAIILLISLEFMNVAPNYARIIIEKGRFRVITQIISSFFLMVVALKIYQLILFYN